MMDPYIGQMAQEALKALLEDQPFDRRIFNAFAQLHRVANQHFYKNAPTKVADALKKIEAIELSGSRHEQKEPMYEAIQLIFLALGMQDARLYVEELADVKTASPIGESGKN